MNSHRPISLGSDRCACGRKRITPERFESHRRGRAGGVPRERARIGPCAISYVWVFQQYVAGMREYVAQQGSLAGPARAGEYDGREAPGGSGYGFLEGAADEPHVEYSKLES